MDSEFLIKKKFLKWKYSFPNDANGFNKFYGSLQKTEYKLQLTFEDSNVLLYI